MATLTQQITEALLNQDEKPEPDYMPPVAEGEKVLGRLTPAAQALFLLGSELLDEYVAAKNILSGTDACGVSCPCSGLRRQYALVRNLLVQSIDDQEETGGATGARDIRAGWTVVETKAKKKVWKEDEVDMADIFNQIFGGAGIGIVVASPKARRETQEV